MMKLEREWEGKLRLTISQVREKTFYFGLTFETEDGQVYEATGRGRTVLGAITDAAKAMPAGFLTRLVQVSVDQIGGLTGNAGDLIEAEEVGHEDSP